MKTIALIVIALALATQALEICLHAADILRLVLATLSTLHTCNNTTELHGCDTTANLLASQELKPCAATPCITQVMETTSQFKFVGGTDGLRVTEMCVAGQRKQGFQRNGTPQVFLMISVLT
jgi:hypothetical protein